MNRFLHEFIRDCSGATAIEYGLIATLVAVAIMTSVAGIGSQLNSSFGRTSSGLATATA